MSAKISVSKNKRAPGNISKCMRLSTEKERMRPECSHHKKEKFLSTAGK